MRTLTCRPIDSGFVLSSELLEGDRNYSHSSIKPKTKSVAGPNDIIGRFEKFIIYGLSEEAVISEVLVNHTKPLKYHRFKNSVIVKLPLVKVDEDWEVIFRMS